MIRWLAIALVVLAATAEAADDPKCGKRPLDVCTKQRVEALRKLSATLEQTASDKAAKPPVDQKEVEALNAYNRWLLAQSEKAAALAQQGQDSLMQETQRSFNLQYLQLRSQMQHENRSYNAVSNVMKTKHDTAKNAINNVR